jgi:phosphatidylglycerophosphatase A
MAHADGKTPTEAAPRPAHPVALVLATWFGAGLSPKAPGTVGTLASFVLWAPLVLSGAHWIARLGVVLVVFVVGVVVSEAVVRARGEDPQLIVIDEVAGMGLTLAVAPPTTVSLLAGFLLFRMFDITKPGPVGLADRRVKGGLGVMLDDMIAGALALAVLTALQATVLSDVRSLW